MLPSFPHSFVSPAIHFFHLGEPLYLCVHSALRLYTTGSCFFQLLFLLCSSFCPFEGMNCRKKDMGTESLSLCCRLWLFCPKCESEQSQLVSAALNIHEINCRYIWFILKLVFPSKCSCPIFCRGHLHPEKGNSFIKPFYALQGIFALNMAQGGPNETKKPSKKFFCGTLQDVYCAVMCNRISNSLFNNIKHTQWFWSVLQIYGNLKLMCLALDHLLNFKGREFWTS